MSEVFNDSFLIWATATQRSPTWSLTLREEHRLMVLENRVLRKIFGPNRMEGTEGWRKLHIVNPQ